MPYDESLTARIRFILARRRNIEEKKMFGGLCFLLHGNMLVGVWKDAIVIRLGPNAAKSALQELYVREFDITGRPMRNWVVVEPTGIEDHDQLNGWIEGAMKFVKTLQKNKRLRGFTRDSIALKNRSATDCVIMSPHFLQQVTL